MTRAILTNGREVEPAHRQSLAEHLGRLNRWLARSDAEDIIPAVSMLRSVMSRSATTDRQEAEVQKTYAVVLHEFPAWAVKRACEDYLSGRAGDGRFAPTPAELAQRCRSVMSRYVEDKAKIERALGITHAPKDPWDEDGLR